MAAAKENLDTGIIITIGILLVVLTFVLILLVQGWFYKAQRDEYVRKVIEPRAEELASAVAEHRPAMLGLIHAETSTGVLQDLRPLRALADELGMERMAVSVVPPGDVTRRRSSATSTSASSAIRAAPIAVSWVSSRADSGSRPISIPVAHMISISRKK